MDGRAALLEQNLARVRARIAAAAERAGREPEDVTMVAVTKYVDAGIARDLVRAGCMDLGESRPQVLWEKADTLSDLSIRWHQIGHLQRNKLRRTLPLVSLVHSVDSQRLLEAIDEIGGERPANVLLEVNVSGEEAKHGFPTAEASQVVERLLETPRVALRGLMCMAGLGTGPTEAQQDFAKLRSLRDQLSESYPEVDLTELSMGMSNDFEAAIAEGATLVRIGSALFQGLDIR